MLRACSQFFAAVIALNLIWGVAAQACTVFASHQGLVPLAGKIRDTLDHHDQTLKVHSADLEKGELWSFLGLFAENGPESITHSPLKMGVNERGLFIGFATASSLPRKLRRNAPYFKDLTHHLLSRAATVEEALQILADIKQPLGARIMILADARKSVLLENSLEGPLVLHRRPQNLATNHFQAPSLRGWNLAPDENSKDRFELAAHLMPLLTYLSPIETSEVLSKLWVPKEKSTHTRSEFTVHYPPGQSPQVRVRMENGGALQTHTLLLEEVFPPTRPACSLRQRLTLTF